MLTHKSLICLPNIKMQEVKRCAVNCAVLVETTKNANKRFENWLKMVRVWFQITITIINIMKCSKLLYRRSGKTSFKLKKTCGIRTNHRTVMKTKIPDLSLMKKKTPFEKLVRSSVCYLLWNLNMPFAKSSILIC